MTDLITDQNCDVRSVSACTSNNVLANRFIARQILHIIHSLQCLHDNCVNSESSAPQLVSIKNYRCHELVPKELDSWTFKSIKKSKLLKLTLSRLFTRTLWEGSSENRRHVSKQDIMLKTTICFLLISI